MKSGWLILLAAFAGCAANYTGSYEGDLQTTISCPNGGPETHILSASYTLSEVDTVLVADADGCIGVPASVKGSSAIVLPYDCGDGNYSPVAGNVHINGGSFTMDGSNLNVVVNGTTGTGDNACDFASSGSLHHISSL